MLAAERETDLALLRHALQAAQDVLRECVQVNALPLETAGALVEAGELDDVVDQRQQPPRLAVDVGGEFLHFFRRHKPCLHQLGKAGDRGQRRFQLV